MKTPFFASIQTAPPPSCVCIFPLPHLLPSRCGFQAATMTAVGEGEAAPTADSVGGYRPAEGSEAGDCLETNGRKRVDLFLLHFPTI